MTTEAERLADELLNPSGLSFPRTQAAALLCSQAAEIERLKAEVQAKSDVLVGSLKVQGQQERLLRQALEALEKSYDVTEWPANGKSRQDAAIAAIHAAGIR